MNYKTVKPSDAVPNSTKTHKTISSVMSYLFNCGINKHLKMICIFTLTYFSINHVAIPANATAIRTIFGKPESIINPGLYIRRPYDKIDVIITGLDTDFKDKLVCKTYDNYYITIPRIYIDNSIECVNDKCILDIYRNYFITDSKMRSKYDNKYVPEEGMIFKYIPEVITKNCQKITLYETQTNKWVDLFANIKDDLQKLVPNGIKIHSVRMEKPDFNQNKNIEYVTSYVGMYTNMIYRFTILTAHKISEFI